MVELYVQSTCAEHRRIDYFLVSARLVPSVKDAFIRPDVMGSDHCPVGLLLETQRQG